MSMIDRYLAEADRLEHQADVLAAQIGAGVTDHQRECRRKSNKLRIAAGELRAQVERAQQESDDAP